MLSYSRLRCVLMVISLSLRKHDEIYKTYHIMRIITLCILFVLSGMLAAQTVDNPTFKARSGSIHNISRIERTPESTRVYIHTIFRPHWWITVEETSYLEDADTGKKYKFKGTEGIEAGKKVYMPDSGEMDYVILYEPLPQETRTIHLLDSDGTENNTYDISLVPQKTGKATPLESIKGNWFNAEQPNKWEIGIYDSISIMQNRIYKNENILKKGKRIELTIKDKQNGTTAILRLTPQKDGNCKISVNRADEYLCTKERSSAPLVTADNGFQNFFHTDSAYLQGYINGYDSRLGFETGMIYLTNELILEDYPTVIEISPDGSFHCKFPIKHPVLQTATIGNCQIPFYIEPGETLTMYINWEDVLAQSRLRDFSLPIKNTAYMGPCASLSYLASHLKKLITYDYNELSKSQKTLTPNQFKEHFQPTITQWKQTGDSLSHIYRTSKKATCIIRNTISQKSGEKMFDFLMSRSYYARQDSTNQVLKVQEDDSFYDFLKETPVNDETILVNYNVNIFINRFEYMNPLRKAYQFLRPQKVNKITTQVEIDKYTAELNKSMRFYKDSIINALCDKVNPLLWQISKLRSLKYQLRNIKTDKVARECVEELKKEMTYPILIEAAEELLKKTHPGEGKMTYQLPEGKATEFFRNIIRNHPGKVLFVDFWATTCAPCRGGIEATAELRKKYKNHPEFQFIYISGEKESPKAAYDQYVEKHLKGEACYYVTGAEFNYLRQLFQFNGIPHYVLVEKDGSISKEDLSSHNIGQYLGKRFNASEEDK